MEVFMIKKRGSYLLLQKIFIFFFIFWLQSFLYATEEAKELIFEIYPQWYSNEDYVLQDNAGIQKDYGGNDRTIFYVKPSVIYSLTDTWSFTGGLGLYYTKFKEGDDNKELRPFLGIGHFIPITEKWILSSYFRAEERLQTDALTEETQETLRLRLRLRTSYMLNPLTKENSWHKIMFGVEGFKSFVDEVNVEIQDNYNTETRITLGAERSLEKKNKVRFEVTWKYQEGPQYLIGGDINTVYFKLQYFPIWGNIVGNSAIS
jgi:hypothetical protein